jgi:hypothetical protein
MMHRAKPNSTVDHEAPPGAALRTSPSASVPAPVLAPAAVCLPPRPTLLPLSFVLTLVALVSFGSALLTLVVAYLFFAPTVPAQAAASAMAQTKDLPSEAPLPEPVKEKPAPPAADTLAVLPFEIDFEPTPAFHHQVEKLNAALPQLLAGEKLHVKPLAQTAPLKYRRDPIEAARALKVRAVLVVKFTTEASQDVSTCHLELIDVVNGYLLWGLQIEAQGGFLKNPDSFAQIRNTIVEQVPKRMVPQP